MRPVRFLRAFTLAWVGLLPLGGQALADPPKVVVTLAPLHSLVASVMAGVGTPTLLINGAASPHGHALRPSDARALADATVVVWVGPALETFMIKPLESLDKNVVQVSLQSLDGVHVLPARDLEDLAPPSGDGHDVHEHEEHEDEDHEDEEHGHAHAHAPGSPDPHLWLDPRHGAALVRRIGGILAEQDPAHAETYRQNTEKTLAALASLDQRLEARLSPVRDRSFVVFHDAYQYFEHRYGLHAAGALTLSPETPAGAARMAQVRQHLIEHNAACVFAEPQFSRAVIEAVTSGTPARAATLDPLGADLEPGPALYGQMMTRLADALADCLTP
ncbi:zinc ABC transporter substrate-binding protein [Pararhodospirillum oryzae]|uniref:High-affinity zinc uptake system protein ZnuA n=1 Tax=Pararhodospirillum oryzae TaxID=478448 RepID=A0A512HBH0_9PROT|nr:zinc ABC transporter substrate-binding protein [Pararhodospirillum oryzae]GEO82740.1 zinc ABC transporter substrate-binding protein [Pararhodospirillum oryzae]